MLERTKSDTFSRLHWNYLALLYMVTIRWFFVSVMKYAIWPQTSLVFTLLLLSRFIAFYPLNAWKESLVLYLTNWFHDAVRLFHNRSQTTSKCWKEPKSDAFWCHLWFIIKQTHRNMSSLSWISLDGSFSVLDSRKLSVLQIIKVWRI